MRFPSQLALLLLGTVVVLAWSVSAGSTGFESVLRMRADPVAWQIVWDIRLPRALGAWLAGALLGLSGAVSQGLFRNPLADPFLLGSASGAALAVALLFVLLAQAGAGQAAPALPAAAWLVQLGVTGAAFIGAVGGVALSLLLARGVRNTLRLLLAGVVVGYVLGALRDWVQLGAPEVLQAMQGFALGVTALIGWHACVTMALVLLPLVLAALALARVLDAIGLGEATARTLGLPLVPLQAALIAVLALGTGTAVAQAGLIGFVGLVAPHLARALARGTHARRLVLATLLGGVLLMLADTAARVIIAPQEVPVGILTAIFGGTYLLWLMHRRGAAAFTP